jgi:hypothetical protein
VTSRGFTGQPDPLDRARLLTPLLYTGAPRNDCDMFAGILP